MQRRPLGGTAWGQWVLMLVIALTGSACVKDSTAPAELVRSVEVSLSAPLLFVGTTGVATAVARDAAGEVVEDVLVRWRSSAATVVEVDDAGTLLARGAGTATITATVGSSSGSAVLGVEVLPASSIVITPSVADLPRGQSVALSAVVRDQLGGVITGRALTWTTSAAGIATVSGAGTVSGVSAGVATIRASLDGIEASARITVTIPSMEGGPAITAITPAVLVPGVTAIITGSNFDATPSGNEVRINGVVSVVTAASATELSVLVPLSGFGCLPTSSVFVQVARGAAATAVLHPLQSAPQVSLAPGEHTVLTSATTAACFELTSGGRYAVSVVNASPTSGTAPGVRVRGAAGLPAASQSVRLAPSDRPAIRVPEVPLVTPSGAGLAVGAALRDAELRAHARLVDANLAILARTPLAPMVAADARLPRAAIARQTPVGAIVPLKIPNVGGFLSGGTDFCQSNFPVNARVVYNGSRAIVVEDTVSMFNGAATLVGQSDSLYRALGEEFDTAMFDVVDQHFGALLRMDDQLDNNGKIIMLFSPRINSFSGLSGFVVSCDFFPASTFPSSNRAEVFYAVVPTVAGSGVGPGTRAYWHWTMRSTVVHEAKHIAAYANRIRDFGGTSALEEAWLEEGLARHAEEIWARRVAYNGLAARSNATYASSLFCDIRPQGQGGGSQCAGKPYAMYRHFGQAGLYDYLVEPEPRSVFGPRIGGSDFTWYASSWSLVRWALDVHDVDEAATLTALVRTNQKGVTNFTARFGRPWEELLGEWSLSLFLDDLPGFVPGSPRLTFPSWNMSSIFAGMRGDFPNTYTRAYPLVPRAVSFGTFDVSIPSVNAGSFTMLELSGASTGRQLIQLSAPGGGAAHGAFRVAVARIQ